MHLNAYHCLMNNSQRPARYTVAQFAKEYGFHLQSVYRQLRRGDLQWFRIGGRIFILPPDENQLSEQRAK